MLRGLISSSIDSLYQRLINAQLNQDHTFITEIATIQHLVIACNYPQTKIVLILSVWNKSIFEIIAKISLKQNRQSIYSF